MSNQALTIYHNPSCSKSREALEILQQQNAQTYIIEYLNKPPSILETIEIIKKLGLAPINLLRTTEKAYIDGEYQANLVSDEEIIAAIAKHPSLLQRPIVICGNKAIIGRSSIKVLDIISKQLM